MNSTGLTWYKCPGKPFRTRRIASQRDDPCPALYGNIPPGTWTRARGDVYLKCQYRTVLVFSSRIRNPVPVKVSQSEIDYLDWDVSCMLCEIENLSK